jgi:hypothetical protein
MNGLYNHSEAAVKVPLRTQKSTMSNSLENSTNCKELISHFEKVHGIPEKLLLAIATVESKKSPWAVNALRKSWFFSTKEAAVRHIQKLKEQGVKNINIGYMQINLQSHGRRFKDIGDILTPYNNIGYAAKLMRILYAQYGSWEEAVKYYHSSSSVYNITYKHKVYSAWANTKGETYQGSNTETVNWTKSSVPLTAQPKRPLLKVVMGPGAGVVKHN